MNQRRLFHQNPNFLRSRDQMQTSVIRNRNLHFDPIEQYQRRPEWQLDPYPEKSAYGEQPPTERFPSTDFYGKGPKGYLKSDQEIKENVCEALARHTKIEASDVEVSVENGVVTMTGTVPDRLTKHLLEEATEECTGVIDINNLVLAKSRTP